MVFLYKSRLYALSTFLVLMLSACSSGRTLMPTPNVYTNNQYSEDKVPSSLRKPEMELIYITDRAPSLEKEEAYGSQRSASMAYGITKLGFTDKALKWNKLLELSNQKQRSPDLAYSIPKTSELGRFPSSPYSFKPSANGMKIDPDVLKQKNFHEKKLMEMVKARLKNSKSKDIVLFIHGFNNTFDDAAYTLGGMWHFLNRQGVPIVYSWPAAEGGLTGYFKDRESGQFTIFHLKEALKLLAKIPEIENINIIAHSRGTDVVTTALREIIIENRAEGGNPRKDLRITNLILAAPDLDFGIVKQRLMAEQFGPAFGQVTIYTSEGDSALGISQWLMNGLRFGLLKSNDIGLNERNIFQTVGNVSLIKVPKSRGFVGHDYFHSNPSVSSDLINLITHKALPGSKKRPLTRIENNFWMLPSNYLNVN